MVTGGVRIAIKMRRTGRNCVGMPGESRILGHLRARFLLTGRAIRLEPPT